MDKLPDPNIAGDLAAESMRASGLPAAAPAQAAMQQNCANECKTDTNYAGRANLPSSKG